MIEIETKNWPITLWWEIIEWCKTTFGLPQWGETWFFQDDYSLYLTEKNLTMFLLRWA